MKRGDRVDKKTAAVQEIVENAVQSKRLYRKTLHETNGVHNAGTRGALICRAAELAGMVQAYRECLLLMQRGGMIPPELELFVGAMLEDSHKQQ